MIFYDSKKNHKKTAFFCHKFMVNFYDKFMQKKSIKLCKKHIIGTLTALSGWASGKAASSVVNTKVQVFSDNASIFSNVVK